jgi:uncharacterized protein (TIGR02147 family)
MQTATNPSVSPPSRSREPRPQAWDFLTTREFVAAFDAWARGHLRGYSRRAFARWAKIPSANALTVIISGERHLSQTWLGPFVRGAKLSDDEAEYLGKLVELESATDRKRREELLESIQLLVAKRGVTSLAGDTLELLRNPLAWTLYSMTGLAGQDGTPKWFKSRLVEKVAMPEIHKALDLLVRLDLVERDERGALRAKAVHLESPDQFKDAQNSAFHRHVLGEAGRVLDTYAPATRAFGSLTLTVDAEDEAAFRDEVNRFGRKMLKKYGKPGPLRGQLFRVNIQLYPLTEDIPS